MTDPAPRWQFKLSDLFVACSLAAVFFAVFTSLPLKFEIGDYRFWPAMIFTVWIGFVVRQLRKGRPWSRPRTVGALFLCPIWAIACGAALSAICLAKFELRFLIFVMAFGACWGIVKSWGYERSSRR